MIRPGFSIVIPTCNRCELLRHALASAVRQSHDDLEIVVSKNQCTDSTDEVIASFGDHRIRVVNTPRRLMMHESWRFAISQARGRYVTFLCDDDALHPRALEITSDAIEQTGADVLYWPLAYWRLGPNQPPSEATFAFGTTYSDRLLEVDRETLIDAAFDLRVTFNEFIPRMLNSMVSRQLLDRAERSGTPLFLPSCPDYSSMLVSAVLAERMVCIDAPLAVAGLTPASIGSSAMQRGEAAREFCRSLLRDEPSLVRLPILLAIRCWIAQSYSQCAATIPSLYGREINLVHLFGWAWIEIRQWRAQGYDVDKVEAEWRDALSQQPESIRDEVQAFIDDRRSIETQAFLSAIEGTHKRLGCGAVAVAGGTARQHGFGSIADFAAGLDEWIALNSISLATLQRDLRALSGGRAAVLYGMGNYGQSLARNLSHGSELLVIDDSADRLPPGCRRLQPEQLRPQEHYVVVTPEHHEPIRRRLEQLGFVCDRDWLAMDGLIRRIIAMKRETNIVRDRRTPRNEISASV